MSIMKTSIDQAMIVLDRTSAALDQVTKRIGTGKKINAPEDDPARWIGARRGRSLADHLQAVNSSLESVAISIRGADEAMETIGKHVEQISTMVKQFPPYPAGDNAEERARLLRSFNGLRDLIDSLTFPPKDDIGRAIMADPASDPGAGRGWKVIVDEQGSVKTIRGQEVHTGATGLDIPELTEAGITTDGQPGGPLDSSKLDAIVDSLETARETLRQRRDSLAADAAAIARAKSFNDKVAQFYVGYADGIETADVNEAAAQAQSLQLRQDLAYESLGSITGMHAELVDLLK